MKLGRRIMIIGCGGAGKSTLARQLGDALGRAVIHLDAHFWQPGWKEMPKDLWRQRVAELVGAESWIIDGNYGDTMDLRLAAADTVIFLDVPWYVCLWRIIKRRVTNHGRTRSDMGPDCREQITWGYLWWVCYSFRRRSRPALLARLREHPDKAVIVLKSRREVRAFLAEVGRGDAG